MSATATPADVMARRAAWALVEGDCLEALRELPDASVDAVVTDPPAGIGFMGKEWDGSKGGREAWIAWLAGIAAEVLRILKPGGHGLVWAIPRTSHWTATALEEAGFEIRDRVSHIFGSGFPKSLDVSKAIDKASGVTREVIGLKASNRPNVVGQAPGGSMGGGAYTERVETAPATPEAAAWEGWGTALKPAVEDWWLVRKPLAEKNLARNVVRHGTGAINVDAFRIDFADEADKRASKAKNAHSDFGSGPRNNIATFGEFKRDRDNYDAAGRWPTHLVLSHAPECGNECAPGCPVAILDEQSASEAVGHWPESRGVGGLGTSGHSGQDGLAERHATLGGASRFFYTAKASRAERDAGLGHIPAASGGAATARRDGSDGLKSPRAGAGRNGGARNIHPTVKPLALMQWLCRLITPPNGVVLDPFAGSGSTLVAALRCGFRMIGVEREPGYVRIARARVEEDEPLFRRPREQHA